MTMCLADLPLMDISSCCFNVAGSPRSINFFSNSSCWALAWALTAPLTGDRELNDWAGIVGGGCSGADCSAGLGLATPPLVPFSVLTGAGCGVELLDGCGVALFDSLFGDLENFSRGDLLRFLLGSGFFSGTNLLASTPRLEATASIAWILAVAAAAATALAEGMTVGVELSPRFLVSGGVMALPTRRYCPPRSNRFIELIAS